MKNEFFSMRGDNDSVVGLQELINYINSVSKIKTQDMRMIEIGSYVGESTKIFAQNFKEVLCIDPFLDDYDANDGACQYMPFDVVYEEFKKNMSGFSNVSHIRKKSDDAISDVEVGKYDFVYIDGMHTYEQVKKDILNYREIIKPNGFVGGHDFHTGFVGVMRAIRDTIGMNIQKFVDTSWVYKLDIEKYEIENLKSKKLLVCIPHHYSEDRVEYLNKVVNNCLSYPMDVDIIIDTNEHNEMIDNYSPNVSGAYHTNLEHPYNLTWKHRLHISELIDEYDYFMYIEDDMLLPFENFLEYLKNFELLYPINCVPSFIRIESNDGKEYVTDITQEQKNVLVTTQGGKVFASLTQPYHAFWIMPQKELKESIKDSFYTNSINRELGASYVMWGLNKMPLVLLDGNKVNKLCYSYHLANNYAKDENSQFGKIELENLIVTPIKELMMEKILGKYTYYAETPSDINEHLPTLYEYAKKCDHVTEMGTRGVVSAWAFMLASPKKLVCYDILKHENVNELIDLAKEYDINLEFIEADVLKTEIEETEFLFIDTLHTYEQLSAELRLHSQKATKYIAFHDTTSFGFRDEADYDCVSDLVKGKEKVKTGLVPAIDEFMNSELGSCWEVEKIFMNNNGLTILKRK